MGAYAVHLASFHIIVLTRREHGFKEEQHEGALHIYPTNSPSRAVMLWDAFTIGRKIIQEHKAKQSTPSSPIVISAQDPLEIGWLCQILALITQVHFHVQVHGDYFSSNGWVGNSLTRRLRRLVALTLLIHAPAIRVVSERIKVSLIARGVAARKITVLPIRPELEIFLSTTPSVHDVSVYTFLFIGRLAPEKDIPRIVRAFAQLHTKYPQTHLRIVGSGEEAQNVEALISEYDLRDAVTRLPWTEDVAGEMAKADVFLLASKHEAYALTLIEAMAVGVPLITTDVGCVGGVVKDGVHGLVVQESGTEAYFCAMERMVLEGTFRKQCGINGKATATLLATQSPETYVHEWVTSVSEAIDSV
jgi:glycosyltransferase involved in cell wall biosynthesis